MRDKIKVGDKSLDFALSDQDGKIFKLSESLGKTSSALVSSSSLDLSLCKANGIFGGK